VSNISTVFFFLSSSSSFASFWTIASNAGVVYLVHGTIGNLPPINLTSLGSNGVYYFGSNGEGAGTAIRGISNVNRDGFNDFMIGNSFFPSLRVCFSVFIANLFYFLIY
jgi:hypothetical protein